MSTLLIVDDSAVVRRCVRSIVEDHPAIRIAGEAHDGEDALDKVNTLRPDIVLLDVDMPRMNGIEAARQIHRLCPRTQIVFFSIHPSSLFNRDLIRSQGFVSKLETETELIPTLDRLMQTMPAGLKGSINYEWQHSVVAAFNCRRESAQSKIEIAEHAIAVRFIDLTRPDRDERGALTEAIEALRQLRSEISTGSQSTQT